MLGSWTQLCTGSFPSSSLRVKFIPPPRRGLSDMSTAWVPRMELHGAYGRSGLQGLPGCGYWGRRRLSMTRDTLA